MSADTLPAGHIAYAITAQMLEEQIRAGLVRRVRGGFEVTEDPGRPRWMAPARERRREAVAAKGA